MEHNKNKNNNCGKNATRIYPIPENIRLLLPYQREKPFQNKEYDFFLQNLKYIVLQILADFNTNIDEIRTMLMCSMWTAIMENLKIKNGIIIWRIWIKYAIITKKENRP